MTAPTETADPPARTYLDALKDEQRRRGRRRRPKSATPSENAPGGTASGPLHPADALTAPVQPRRHSTDIRPDPLDPSSTLDPVETSPQIESSTDVTFRHSWWSSDRHRVFQALGRAFGSCNRLNRFASCGDAAWIYRTTSTPSRYKVIADHCRDRWCRACQRDRSRKLVANVKPLLNSPNLKLITLTLKSDHQSLRSLIDRLFESFRTLRRTRIWRDNCIGGISFLEVKRNTDPDRWHPHLHIIADTNFIPKRLLSSLWRGITGDSFIVDIKVIRDTDKAAAYVAKYATKPLDTAIYRQRRYLLEAIVAMKGRRMVCTFGTFRGNRLADNTDENDWVACGTLSSIRRRADLGDPDAMAIMAELLKPGVEHDQSRAPPRETESS